MDGTLLMAGGTAVMTALGRVESRIHRYCLGQIPLRIYVNGTRGKSSVTRLIAAGLRAGGIRTSAKTTGDLPRVILPDGCEYPVFRPCRATVIEQLRAVRAAAAQCAQALVVEGMSLPSRLQSLCELQLVRSTHGVVTNVQSDRPEGAGPTPADVARALAGAVPHGGELFTTEQHHLAELHQTAASAAAG